MVVLAWVFVDDQPMQGFILAYTPMRCMLFRYTFGFTPFAEFYFPFGDTGVFLFCCLV